MDLSNQIKNKKLLKLAYIYYRVNLHLFSLSFYDNDERIEIINDVLHNLHLNSEINTYLNKNNLSKFSYDYVETYIKLYILRTYYDRLVNLRYTPDENNIMYNLYKCDNSTYNVEKHNMKTKYNYFNNFVNSNECKFISMDFVNIIPDIDKLLS